MTITRHSSVMEWGQKGVRKGIKMVNTSTYVSSTLMIGELNQCNVFPWL